MKRHMTVFLKFAIVLGIVATATPALAGPPLLCHPYDIGSARSLPWNDAAGWTGTRADYTLGNLVADTEALLTPSTPVVVRMETLRRAAIYASMDAAVAKQLVTRLNARVDAAEAAGHPDAHCIARRGLRNGSVAPDLGVERRVRQPRARCSCSDRPR